MFFIGSPSGPDMFTTPLIVGILPNLTLLFGAFALLLFGAELFTNGVEWLGHHLGVSESATGSLLAAVGTALPETMIPVIAILSVVAGTGDQAAADEVGVGAILGAPFMLATIAMFLIGIAVLLSADRREAGGVFTFDPVSARRDLSFFFAGYVLAVSAAFIPKRSVSVAIAVALVALYLIYVWVTLSSGELLSGEGMENLHLSSLLTGEIRPFPPVISKQVPINEPRLSLVFLQSVIALGVIISGAHLFVGEVQFFADRLSIPAAVVALLLAPLATELPEKFNSVIWIGEGKDTLALGNITGAMVFQGTLPATLGILFTSWDLTVEWGTVGFLNALSAGLALVGAGLILGRVLLAEDEEMRPAPFLLGGLLYAVFIVVLVYHVLFLDVSAAAAH
jgi:cation:H+ antiporter